MVMSSKLRAMRVRGGCAHGCRSSSEISVEPTIHTPSGMTGLRAELGIATVIVAPERPVESPSSAAVPAARNGTRRSGKDGDPHGLISTERPVVRDDQAGHRLLIADR